ncbi:MAG: hypothetical protein AB8B91_21690 [Rubripirellula sp.]
MSSLLSIVSLLLAGVAPGSPATATPVMRQQVDMIELNHFVDEEGREVFQQVIFYDWSKTQRRFHVRAWRLIKKESQMPQRRWEPAGYQCTWHDEGMLRQVWAPKLRETWSQRDPERVNRALLAEDQRLPLFPSRVATSERETPVTAR